MQEELGWDKPTPSIRNSIVISTFTKLKKVQPTTGSDGSHETGITFIVSYFKKLPSKS